MDCVLCKKDDGQIGINTYKEINTYLKYIRKGIERKKQQPPPLSASVSTMLLHYETISPASRLFSNFLLPGYTSFIAKYSQPASQPHMQLFVELANEIFIVYVPKRISGQWKPRALIISSLVVQLTLLCFPFSFALSHSLHPFVYIYFRWDYH